MRQKISHLLIQISSQKTDQKLKIVRVKIVGIKIAWVKAKTYIFKETLPIKEVRYGDVKAGGDEYGSSTVGKLECKWDYLMGMDSNIFASDFE